MPRKRSTEPGYRYHVSGQAVVTLDGRNYYLGTHDTPESRAKYYALLQKYNANGLRMPADVETHKQDQPVTVCCLTAQYRVHADKKYANDSSRRSKVKNLCTLLDDEYAETPISEFGPLKLRRIRELLTATKNRQGTHNTRSYVNSQIRDIMRIFKFGVSFQLVDAISLTALETLDPLTPNESEARESDPVEGVDIETVRLTARHLSPVIKTMVALQVATGMRPSEIFRMRPRDIEVQADGVWVYRPPKHKTSHKGKSRAIPITGPVRLALQPFVDGRDSEDYCFKPDESAAWHREQRTAKRATPANQGDRPGYTKATRAGDTPGRKYSSQFTKDSYARAIKRAAEKAGADHWFPYQLRHSAAESLGNAMPIEFVQALMGHSHAAMTAHYAKQSLSKAIEATKGAPQL